MRGNAAIDERLVREVAQYYTVYGRPEHWVFPQRGDATRHMDGRRHRQPCAAALRGGRGDQLAGRAGHGAQEALRV